MNLPYAIETDDLVVLRIRKGAPGVGQRIGRAFGANQVTCKSRPNRRVRDGAVIFNYGRSEWPVWCPPDDKFSFRWLNTPDAVAKCVDKRETLRSLTAAGVPCLEYCHSDATAQVWLIDGHRVFARHKVAGKKGQGIQVLNPGDEAIGAPLYTKDFPKVHEYRVHVFNGQVIDITQKKRKGKKKREELGIKLDEDVRNHAKGWVFAHKDLHCDQEGYRETISEISIAGCNALGLDFGGVDLLVDADNNAVICEINSAPGMRCSETREAYFNAIKGVLI